MEERAGESTLACQWGKKGTYHEETGRSRGELTTKVHAVTEGLGNPQRFLLSSGNRNDICMARELLGPFDLHGKLILADRDMTATNSFAGWKNAAASLSFPVVKPQRTTVTLTKIYITSGILRKSSFLSSKVTAGLPLVTRRKLSLFLLSLSWPVFSFGCFNSFNTDSSAVIRKQMFFQNQ